MDNDCIGCWLFERERKIKGMILLFKNRRASSLLFCWSIADGLRPCFCLLSLRDYPTQPCQKTTRQKLPLTFWGFMSVRELRGTNCSPKTNVMKMRKTFAYDFAPHCINAMLAVALLLFFRSSYWLFQSATWKKSCPRRRKCGVNGWTLRGLRSLYAANSFKINRGLRNVSANALP